MKPENVINASVLLYILGLNLRKVTIAITDGQNNTT